VCDPPPFVKDIEDFEKILALVFEKLNPSGLIFATTYLGTQYTPLDFYRAVQVSSERASRNVKLIEPLYEGPDFPVLPTHPQGIHLFGHILYAD
jgi:23S rRNA G2069 N7-methylase RlmK/C1962 C5-methylase RlmI